MTEPSSLLAHRQRPLVSGRRCYRRCEITTGTKWGEWTTRSGQRRRREGAARRRNVSSQSLPPARFYTFIFPLIEADTQKEYAVPVPSLCDSRLTNNEIDNGDDV